MVINCRIAARSALAMLCMSAWASFAVGGEWGPESDGIQCRLVAISPDTDDEGPDLSSAVEAFARGEEVTFGVELKNVSDEAVSLLGVRVGEDFGADSGRLATESMGPRRFEFEFTDRVGKATPRVSRVYTEEIYGLLDASVHELAPGQSLVVALRPARFWSPMYVVLPAGEYLARVRYRGPTRESIVRIRSLGHHDRPQGRAWTGVAESNQVAFRVAAGHAAKPQAELPWGEERRGLCAAVELRGLTPRTVTVGAKAFVPLNSAFDAVLCLKNVSARPISFVSSSEEQRSVTVTGADGVSQGHQVGGVSANTGMPVVVRWTLEPGETLEFVSDRVGAATDLATARSMHPPAHTVLAWKRGVYTVRGTIRIGGFRQGDVPAETDWEGELATGETPLLIR